MPEYINDLAVYADNTLMCLNKQQLIQHIRMLEHNWKGALETNERIYQNVKGWQPVRHGHWEYDKKHDVTYCSICLKTNDVYRTSYCPHCGAKMDEWETE